MNYKCHYDIASVIFDDEYISSSFKYDEDKSKWFYKDIDDTWNEDKKLMKLKYEITTRGFDKFIKKYEKVNEKKDEISFYNSVFGFYILILQNVCLDFVSYINLSILFKFTVNIVIAPCICILVMPYEIALS